MRHYKLATALICISVMGACPAIAGDMAHRTVEQVIDAYGGKKFETLKSIRVDSDLRYSWFGQGKTSKFTELEPMRKVYEIDLKKNWGIEEAWGGQGGYAERVITTDTGQKTVNYLTKTYSDNPDGEFYDHFGGEIRTVDTLLAYELMKHRKTAEYKGRDYYDNNLHHIIEFDMPGTSIEPKIWVHSESGLISRMERVAPAYAINYIYANHQTTGGITYSDDFSLYIDDKLIEYAKSRNIAVNRVKPSTFKIERGIVPEAESLEQSELTVEKVTGSVYQVGQRGAYSAFIDEGEHLIAAGLYGGFKNRYDAYTEANGVKPVKYVIATHHHSDHLGGTQDALELGATIIAPKPAEANLKEAAEGAIPDSKIQFIDEESFTLGPIDVHMIDTPHVSDYGLVYIRDAKTIFQEDHYSGSLKDQASHVGLAGVALKAEADRLGLEVDYLLSGHGRKIEKWDAFSQMAETRTPGLCPTGRKICRDLK